MPAANRNTIIKIGPHIEFKEMSLNMEESFTSNISGLDEKVLSTNQLLSIDAEFQFTSNNLNQWYIIPGYKKTVSFTDFADTTFEPQQSENEARSLWKQERTKRVSEIKVTTAAGNEFDGDEISQSRMARAISVMSSTDTTTWILANNNPATVTRAELKEALKLAGEEQTFIWIQ